MVSIVVNAAPVVDGQKSAEDLVENLPKDNKMRSLELNQDLFVALYGTELINKAGIMLELSQVVIATAQVLYHRFFRGIRLRKKSIEGYPPFHVAMACVYLGTKVEEEKRRHRDVLNVFDRIRKRDGNKALSVLDPYGKRYHRWKNGLLKLELIILCNLGYRLKFEHPHKFILNYINVLEADEKVAQKAWSYLNDSLRLPVVIDIKPEVLACSAIFLAARHLQVKLPDNPPWHLLFDVTREEIERVSNVIIELYRVPAQYFEKLHHTEPKSTTAPKKKRTVKKAKIRSKEKDLATTKNTVKESEAPRSSSELETRDRSSKKRKRSSSRSWSRSRRRSRSRSKARKQHRKLRRKRRRSRSKSRERRKPRKPEPAQKKEPNSEDDRSIKKG